MSTRNYTCFQTVTRMEQIDKAQNISSQLGEPDRVSTQFASNHTNKTVGKRSYSAELQDSLITFLDASMLTSADILTLSLAFF